MSTKDYMKRIGVHACVYFTAVAVFLIFFACLQGLNINPVALLLVIPFSFLFAVANIQFKYASFKTVWRVILHGVLTVGGMFCCVYLPNRVSDQVSVHFGFLVGMLLIYATVMGIILGIRARANRVKRDATHYKSVYKEKNNGKNDNAKRTDKKQKQDDYQNVFKKK